MKKTFFILALLVATVSLFFIFFNKEPFVFVEDIEIVKNGENIYHKVTTNDGKIFVANPNLCADIGTTNWKYIGKNPIRVKIAKNGYTIKIEAEPNFCDTARLSSVKMGNKTTAHWRKVKGFGFRTGLVDYYDKGSQYVWFDCVLDNGVIINSNIQNSYDFDCLRVKYKDYLFSIPGDYIEYKSVYGAIEGLDYYRNLSINLNPQKVTKPQKVVKKYTSEDYGSVLYLRYIRVENGDIINMEDVEPAWLWDSITPDTYVIYDKGGKKIKLIKQNL